MRVALTVRGPNARLRKLNAAIKMLRGQREATTKDFWDLYYKCQGMKHSSYNPKGLRATKEEKEAYETIKATRAKFALVLDGLEDIVSEQTKIIKAIWSRKPLVEMQ